MSIRPPIPLEIGAMERDPVQLRRVYDTGRAVAENQDPEDPGIPVRGQGGARSLMSSV